MKNAIDAQMDKLRLLDLIRAEHGFLRRALAELSENEMLSADLGGGWTAKDVMAHVTAWERRFYRSWAAAEAGDADEWPEPGYTIDDVDRLNADDVAANKDRPLADVLIAFNDSYKRLLARTAEQPSEVLFSPGHYEFTREHPLYLFLAANTYEHYQEHAVSIREWVASRGAAG